MVGSCAALALAGRGMRVALIEAAPAGVATIGADEAYDLRVSAISPRSRQILQQLGIWQQLDAARICYYEQMHIWHHARTMPDSHRYGINFGLSLSCWDYLFGTAHIPHDGRDVELEAHQ